MELTPRQRTFLQKLSELCRENEGPVHYSLVAEKLNVNRFSAYDMLKLLERKGMVASEYVLDAEQSGPGRSMIVFYPTRKAAHALYAPREKLEENWQQIKEKILQKLGEARATNYREMLNDFLARMPEGKSPLVYCAETIAALLLNLNNVQEKASELNPFGTLISLGPTGEVALGTLAGLSVGTLFTEQENVSLVEKLLACTKSYQNHLRALSEESKSALSDFLQEALAILDRPSYEK